MKTLKYFKYCCQYESEYIQALATYSSSFEEMLQKAALHQQRRNKKVDLNKADRLLAFHTEYEKLAKPVINTKIRKKRKLMKQWYNNIFLKTFSLVLVK